MNKIMRGSALFAIGLNIIAIGVTTIVGVLVYSI